MFLRCSVPFTLGWRLSQRVSIRAMQLPLFAKRRVRLGHHNSLIFFWRTPVIEGELVQPTLNGRLRCLDALFDSLPIRFEHCEVVKLLPLSSRHL